MAAVEVENVVIASVLASSTTGARKGIIPNVVDQ
jgi:hypothetical protein